MSEIRNLQYFKDDFWNKQREEFLSREEGINGIILGQDWNLVGNTTANSPISLPSLDTFDEIYVEMFHSDGTVMHQEEFKKESLLFESTNTTHREILLDSINDAQTYVTYNMIDNTITATCIEGIDIDENSVNVFLGVYVKSTGTADGGVSATKVNYDDSESNLGVNNIQEAINVLSNREVDLSGVESTIENLENATDNLENYVNTLENDIKVVNNTLGWNTSKNLLANTLEIGSKSIASVTYTINDDRSVTLNGTSTGGFNITLTHSLYLPKGEYILTGCPEGGSDTTYRMTIQKADGTYIYEYGNGVRFTIDDNEKIAQVTIYAYGIQTYDNLTFYPMIRKADVTDDTYEPYAPTVDARLDTVESALEWKLVGSGETVTLTDTIINNAKEIMVLNYGKVQTSGVYWQVATTHIIPKEMMTQIISIYNSSTSYQVVRFFFSYNNDKTVPMYYDIPNKKFTSTNGTYTLYVYYR